MVCGAVAVACGAEEEAEVSTVVFISPRGIGVVMAWKRPVGWRRHSREHSLAAHGISLRRRVRKPRLLEADGVSEMRDRIRFPEMSVDYHNPEEVFTAFWVANKTGDYSNFDFESGYMLARDAFRHRLALNGALGGEVFLEALETEAGVEPVAAKDLGFANVTTSGVIWELEAWTEEQPEYWRYVEDRLENMIAEDRPEDLDGYMRERAAELGLRAEYLGDVWHRPLKEDEKEYLAEWVAGRVWNIAGQFDEWVELEDTYVALQNPPESRALKVALMDRAINAVHITGGIWGRWIADVGILRSRFDRLAQRELGY